MTYSLACVLAIRLLRRGARLGALMAAAAMWQFDTYFRAGEIVKTVKEDILPSASRIGARYGSRRRVLVGNQDRNVRTKTNVVDGSLEIGCEVRSRVADVARHLFRIAAAGANVYPSLGRRLRGRVPELCHHARS
jgi:hypothetical protein